MPHVQKTWPQLCEQYPFTSLFTLLTNQKSATEPYGAVEYNIRVD